MPRKDISKKAKNSKADPPNSSYVVLPNIKTEQPCKEDIKKVSQVIERIKKKDARCLESQKSKKNP